MEKTNNVKIVVKKEPHEGKDGKMYNSYSIKSKIRDVELNSMVVPHDNGGYKILDIVYGKELEAELLIKPYEMKDEKSGAVVKGNTYSVRTVDENGMEYECPVRPFRKSDKIGLELLIKKINAQK